MEILDPYDFWTFHAMKVIAFLRNVSIIGRRPEVYRCSEAITLAAHETG